MATVRMRRGTKYADIFDSPEMIAGAEADGYVLVKDEPKVEVPRIKEEKPTEKVEKVEEPKTPSRTSATKRQ